MFSLSYCLFYIFQSVFVSLSVYFSFHIYFFIFLSICSCSFAFFSPFYFPLLVYLPPFLSYVRLSFVFFVRPLRLSLSQFKPSNIPPPRVPVRVSSCLSFPLPRPYTGQASPQPLRHLPNTLSLGPSRRVHSPSPRQTRPHHQPVN